MAAVINLKLTVMTINEMESQKLSDDADSDSGRDNSVRLESGSASQKRRTTGFGLRSRRCYLHTGLSNNTDFIGCESLVVYSLKFYITVKM